MSNTNPFGVAFTELPGTLPIFPLPGAIVLPRQILSLNIFEPRYLNMINDALGGARMFGMVQPITDLSAEPVQVHRVGCAGRITAFKETEDGRLVINLTGVCRFAIAAEHNLHPRGYRLVTPDWSAYAPDFEPETAVSIGLNELEPALRAYFSARRIEPSWGGLKGLSAASLTDFLAMNLPFDPATKQGMVEAPSVEARAHLVKMALTGALLDDGAQPPRHH